MNYRLYYTKEAKKALKKLDKPILVMVKAWIEKNLNNTDDPRRYGKTLKGKYSGYWRYRVGNYRLICEIRDQELVIILIDLGHRREIYR
ncbi:type II toxin-antitoxin system RelE/ParE family toxin [Varibaculum cambriense]|uniref:type II toxin-antitoxin system RelE family toxin n=1 Tax=Varibaculum cambriense TaxID=184870 RepID=UPI0028FDF8DE|nr:type II toxin-antitoxin system RelE/ParE family toxin [Varibaculum cambriense]MDU1224973.1 type II toxin-antitoxin system RelE/ParE family toxin [Varibaculum cambriense]